MNNNLITLSKKVDNQKLKEIQILLDNGQNPNIQDKTLYTPLMYACMNNDIKLVELLLKYKADPNIKNNRGNTSLMIACRNGNIKIIKLLLKTYKNINDQDNSLCTPLWYVISSISVDKVNLNIVKLLLKLGANPNIKQIDGNTVLMNVPLTHSNCINIMKLLRLVRCYVIN